MKVFLEEQRFNQWWIYVILSLSFAVSLWRSLHRYFNDENKAFIDILVTSLIFLLILFFAFSMKLKTRIDEKGIYYQFFPINFKQKFISWNVINTCFVRQYKPIVEYGGWGFRSSFGFTKGNVAYNVRGNIGIQLELKNGKQLLIGTQKESDAQKVLATYAKKITDKNN